MKFVIIGSVAVVQIVLLAWFIPAAIKAHRRQKKLEADIHQELQHTETAMARFRRAADPTLTETQASAILAELHAAQIMLKQRAEERDKQHNSLLWRTCVTCQQCGHESHPPAFSTFGQIQAAVTFSLRRWNQRRTEIIDYEAQADTRHPESAGL